MVMISTGDWLLRAVVCLGAVFSMAEGVWAQSPTFSITLTGQSLIRSDVRAHAPATVPTIASLLKGDVVFTNFEATIFDVKRVSRRRTVGSTMPCSRRLPAAGMAAWDALGLDWMIDWDLAFSFPHLRRSTP